jgi:hypothetical protein
MCKIALKYQQLDTFIHNGLIPVRLDIPRLYLGEGKNGTVRYPKKEVMAY